MTSISIRLRGLKIPLKINVRRSSFRWNLYFPVRINTYVSRWRRTNATTSFENTVNLRKTRATITISSSGFRRTRRGGTATQRTTARGGVLPTVYGVDGVARSAFGSGKTVPRLSAEKKTERNETPPSNLSVTRAFERARSASPIVIA